jgi:hypothetical protein
VGDEPIDARGRRLTGPALLEWHRAKKFAAKLPLPVDDAGKPLVGSALAVWRKKQFLASKKPNTAEPETVGFKKFLKRAKKKLKKLASGNLDLLKFGQDIAGKVLPSVLGAGLGGLTGGTQYSGIAGPVELGQKATNLAAKKGLELDPNTGELSLKIPPEWAEFAKMLGVGGAVAPDAPLPPSPFSPDDFLPSDERAVSPLVWVAVGLAAVVLLSGDRR